MRILVSHSKVLENAFSFSRLTGNFAGQPKLFINLETLRSDDKENKIIDESDGEEVYSGPQKHYHNIDKQ